MSKVVLVYKAGEVGPVCQRLSKAAEEAGLKPFVVTNNGIGHGGKVVVRWGTLEDIHLPMGGMLINEYTPVALARDKKKSRQALSGLSPKTFYTAQAATFPCVVRPKRHHAAKKFFVAHTPLQLKKAVIACKLGWYGSELVKKDREFRVFVLHGRIVAVSERFPGNSTSEAWNLAAGGKLINCKYASWPLPVLKAAIEATATLGLDFSAMDIATEKVTGRVVVFEANTAPGLKNPFTLACIAKAFAWNLDHELPKAVVEGATKWQHYLHPALKPNRG